MRAVAVLLLMALALAACGRKGAPSPPGPPNEVTYPRMYPAYLSE
jgi:predicted small lipoprotein YifL